MVIHRTVRSDHGDQPKDWRSAGYFVSATEFEEYLKVRDLLPKSRFAWEMPAELVEELEKPLNRCRPELDALMEE
jgi:hypothetical protein